LSEPSASRRRLMNFLVVAAIGAVLGAFDGVGSIFVDSI
jgi:hypothetical protein